MAEIIVNLNSNNLDSRKMAKVEYSKMNLHESISIEKIEEEIYFLNRKLS